MVPFTYQSTSLCCHTKCAENCSVKSAVWNSQVISQKHFWGVNCEVQRGFHGKCQSTVVHKNNTYRKTISKLFLARLQLQLREKKSREIIDARHSVSESTKASITITAKYYDKSLLREWFCCQFTITVTIPAAIYRSAQGPGPESAPRSAFWVFLGTWLRLPQRVFFFGNFRAKKRQKALKKHSWGTPSQVPKNTQKALRGALSGPGPWALL